MLPNSRPLRCAALVAMGALAGLGQAPQGLWWLTLFMLTGWMLWPVTSRKSAFGVGWWFGFGYFAVSLRWIVSPFLVDAGSTGWMAPFGVIAMAAGGALFWGIARWAAFRLKPASILIVGLALTAAEAARALVLSGFPWALLGHVWIDTPVAQLASVGGPHLLTLMLVVLAWSCAVTAQGYRGGVLGPVVGLALWLSIALPPVDGAGGPMVRILQPNAPQSEKWDPIKSQIFLKRMIEMTAEGERPDLIVWPETSVPSLYEYAQEDLIQISDAARGAPTVLGINRREGSRYYNAALVVERGAQVTSIYDKAHIVPFGEYIPGGEILAKLGITMFSAEHGRAFSAGAGPRVVNIEGIGPARPLICYEGIFAEEIGTQVRPRLMILITNDAWFGSSAGPRQHLAQARLRAIEQGLPMVRSANTGISAMIDPYGRVVASTQLNQEASLDVALPAPRSATIYSRFGDLPVLLVLALIGATCWLTGQGNPRLTRRT